MPVQTQMQVRRGTASSWTSTNPTLAAGELGFETDTGKFKIGTGASTWTALLYAGGGQSSLTTYQYTATAGQTTFSGADVNSNTLSYTVGAIQVYLNGALLANTTDYAATNGTSVVLTGGAGLGDSLTIISFATFDVANTYTQAQADALFIADTIVDAKGDIIAATAADTVSRLAVGANDTVLTADSSTATGLKWAAPAVSGDSWTLLNAGGTALTGAQSITVSGISAKNSLFIAIDGASSNSNGTSFTMRFNADSGNNYDQFGAQFSVNSTYDSSVFTEASNVGVNSIGLASTGNSASARASAYLTMSGANTTAPKIITGASGLYSDGQPNGTFNTFGGVYLGTSTISEVLIRSAVGNFDAGTIYVYTSA